MTRGGNFTARASSIETSNDSEKRAYAVIGGTGFLGQRIAANLLRNGHKVRIVARCPERGGELLRHDRAQAFRADILRPETLEAALDGASGVINAVSLYRETASIKFEDVHCIGAAKLAMAARRVGAGGFVQVSGIGAHPAASNAYIRARGRGEEAVMDALPSAVIVRPSVMCGQGDAFISSVVSSARRLPMYPLFGRGDTRLQPVHVDDVALACAELLSITNGEDLYEFGGPRILTYRKLVGEIADAYGLRVRMVPVPYPIWRLLAAAAVLSRYAPITPAQVALIEKDNIASSTAPGLRSLGIDARDILSTIARGSF